MERAVASNSEDEATKTRGGDLGNPKLIARMGARGIFRHQLLGNLTRDSLIHAALDVDFGKLIKLGFGIRAQFLALSREVRVFDSTIGARFIDGKIVEPFATEIAITSGIIAPGAGGALESTLEVALVDYTGGIAEGRLIRGDNPVLMTMELVLEALG